MNVENILKLADIIEQEPHVENFYASSGFHMCLVEHDCGSPMCIAGYAKAEFVKTAGKDALYGVDSYGKDSYDFASEYLGLDRTAAVTLFEPRNIRDWNDITPKIAAQTLRHLATTGSVDFQKFIKLSKTEGENQ